MVQGVTVLENQKVYDRDVLLCSREVEKFVSAILVQNVHLMPLSDEPRP